MIAKWCKAFLDISGAVVKSLVADPHQEKGAQATRGCKYDDADSENVRVRIATYKPWSDYILFQNECEPEALPAVELLQKI